MAQGGWVRGKENTGNALHITYSIRFGRWSALGPAQSLSLHRFLAVASACRRAKAGKGGTRHPSVSQGHIPAATWRCRQVRRILYHVMCNALGLKDLNRLSCRTAPSWRGDFFFYFKKIKIFFLLFVHAKEIFIWFPASYIKMIY